MKCRKQLAISCLPSGPLFSTGTCAQSPSTSPRELPCSSHSNQTFHFHVPHCCFLPHPFLKSYFLPGLGPRRSKICISFPSQCLTSNLLYNPCLSQATSANWIQWRNSLNSNGSTAHSSSLPKQAHMEGCWDLSSDCKGHPPPFPLFSYNTLSPAALQSTVDQCDPAWQPALHENCISQTPAVPALKVLRRGLHGCLTTEVPPCTTPQ